MDGSEEKHWFGHSSVSNSSNQENCRVHRVFHLRSSGLYDIWFSWMTYSAAVLCAPVLIDPAYQRCLWSSHLHHGPDSSKRGQDTESGLCIRICSHLQINSICPPRGMQRIGWKSSWSKAPERQYPPLYNISEGTTEDFFQRLCKSISSKWLGERTECGDPFVLIDWRIRVSRLWCTILDLSDIKSCLT